MAPVPNHRLLYVAIPGTGYPVPGVHTKIDGSQVIDLDNVEVTTGKVLVKHLRLSVDPYMRPKMRDPSIPSYTPAYELGEPLYGYGVAKAVRSSAPGIKPGDIIYGTFTFEEYSIVDGAGLRVLPNKEGLPLSLYVGVLGMPGQTAYYGYKAKTEAKKGETIYISSGSGVVGSLLIQLAKADGLKVIASAGSDDKVAYLKEIGTDVAFNYKTTSTDKVMKEHGPVDIYWDMVGGQMLDTLLLNMAQGGRIIIVGQASQYNADDRYGIKELWQMLVKDLTMKGLLVWNHAAQYEEEFYATLPARVKSGELKYREVVVKGLENADKTLVGVLDGSILGKAVISVAED